MIPYRPSLPSRCIRLLVLVLPFVLLPLAQPALASPTDEPAQRPAAPPPNDNLAAAIVVDRLPFGDRQDVEGATMEAGELLSGCSLAEDELGVWYRLEVTSPTTVAFDTEGSELPLGGELDTALSVWTGGPGHPLTEIACNDDATLGMFWSRLVLRLAPGQPVFVKVGSNNPDGGTVRLSAVAASTVPANDNLADAAAIASVPFTNTQNLTFATFEANEVVSACQYDWPQEHGVWYRLGDIGGQSVVLDSQGSLDPDGNPMDTVLSLWSGGPGHPLDEILCSDDVAEGEPWSRIVLDPTPGTVYYVKLAGLAGSVGQAHLNAGATPAAPANDGLAAAAPIDALPFAATVDTTAATDEAAEARSQCSDATAPERGAWFRYQPAQDARVVFAGARAPFPPVVSVWTGTGSHPLTEVACSADRVGTYPVGVIADVVAGTTYYVKISGLMGQGGEVAFVAVVAPPLPTNDNLADATTIESLPYSDRRDVTNATDEPGEVRAGCAFIPGAERAIWYRYQATTAVRLLVEGPGGEGSADAAGTVSVWTGGPGHPLTQVACAVAPSSVQVAVEAGVEVFIKIGPALNEVGAVRLGVKEAPQPPPHDNLAAAKTMAPLPFGDTFDSRSATEEADEVRSKCVIDPDEPELGAWYRFSSTTPTGLELSAEGSQVASAVSVWRGGPGHPLTEVTCTSLYLYGGAPKVRLAAEADVVYYIKIAADGGHTGNLALSGALVPLPPANDDLKSAVSISSVPFTDELDTRSATDESAERRASCALGTGEEAGVWYRVAPEAWAGAVSLVVDTGGSDFDTILSAWFGGSDHPLIEMACSDDTDGDSSSRLILEPRPREDVYLKVGGRSGAGGNLTLSVSVSASRSSVFLPSLER